MHDYTAAPACAILATHCTACGRPLLDAESVTAGLGPICRDKYGIPDELDEETRTRANKLVYLCARADVSHEDFTAAIVELSLLGCDALAKRMADRAGRVVLIATEDGVDVQAPYSEAFLANRGRGRWVGADKVTRYAAAHAPQAINAVQRAFGRQALVRLEYAGGKARFVAADDARLHAVLAAMAERAPAPAPEPEACPPKWTGSPCRIGDAWGVCIKAGAAQPKAGERVNVQARNGKTWTATLATDARRGRFGWEAATKR